MSVFLVTGGAGFIGANYLNMMVDKYPDDYWICYDKMTYAADIARLLKVKNKLNFIFIKGDICDEIHLEKIFKKYNIDYIVNFAAESHVDNSIFDPKIFYESNVIGVLTLLEISRKYNIKRFHQVSTDEVYGSIENGTFSEESKLNPSSPYSSSKAAADLLVLSFKKTYNLDVTISRSSNNYGPMQHVEKLIPKAIDCINNDKKIPIYGNGNNVRNWIHVDDHSRAIDLIVREGVSGQIYNVSTEFEISNIDLINLIIKLSKVDNSLIELVEDRKGHDFRYSICSNKLKKMGWKPNISFVDGITMLINCKIK